MSFLHPEFLYYMLPPLLILFGFLFTQKEANAHFFSEDVMNRLRVGANILTLKARNALFLLMGFFIIVALAQPVIKEQKVEVKAKSADVMIAMDISDSMLATDVYPNRLESAKQKVLSLLNEDINERIGLVAFAKNSYLVSPLSFDTKAVAFLLNNLDTTSITEKGTDFLSLLDVVSRVQENRDKKHLLILSDGGDKSDFSDEIELAKKHGITVFVLGIATKKGSPIKLKDGTFIKHNGDIIISKLNENISDLALKTGGIYIQNIASSDDIKRMLKEIIGITGEKELKSEEIQMHKPLFYYPLGVAVFILLIATSSLGSRKKVNTLSLFMLFSLFVNFSDAQAGVLDFLQLKNAKESYNSGDYKESAKIYEQYAKESLKPEAYFNSANAYYKQEKYKEAIEYYKKALSSEEQSDKKAKSYSNLGNAYVKEANQESLKKAIEAYEKSLEINEDKQTRENLQEVKKYLEKQKEKSKDNQQNSDDKKDSDEQKDKDSKQDDKNQDSKDAKDKESDKKEESKDKKDSSNSKNSDKKEKNSDDAKNKKDEQDRKPDTNQTKAENKKDDLKELGNRDKNSSNKSLSSMSDKDSMSDAEEKKWLQQLNSRDNTYLYRLNREKSQNRDSDEKPW